MTDVQLYLAIVIPSLTVLLGILMNTVLFNNLSTKITSMESRLDGRMDRQETRLEALSASFATKFDILTGKVVELDNRLTRLEERLKH